jgi:phage-related protein
MASNSIYDIDSWQTATNYSKNRIIKRSGLYYYALVDHTSTAIFSNDLNSGYWGGYITDNAESKPFFLWKPSYNHSTDNQPKVKTIQFGDSYKQVLRDGISNVLPTISLEFQCDLAECAAILHFLETRAGAESFVFLSPAPRNQLARYTCPQWNDSQKFRDNYRISCRFERSIV